MWWRRAFVLGALLLTGASDLPYCGPDVFVAPAPVPFGTATSPPTCPVYHVAAPRASLSLAVAVDEAERARGLMLVRVLPVHTGMLFVFPDGDLERVFWMKNTLVPLDMIFVRADGTVDRIARNVPATTAATLDQNIPRRAGDASYVIELRAGEAARDGIAIGARLALEAPGKF